MRIATHHVVDLLLLRLLPEVWILLREIQGASVRKQDYAWYKEQVALYGPPGADEPPAQPPVQPPVQNWTAPTAQKTYTPEELERDLSTIIGLEHVKNSIRDIYYTIRTNQQRREQGLATTHQALHMVFLGNPGTGKTTVARLLGEMFRRMGVLSRGHFVETDATGLVAEYVGQTGPKTTQKIREAMGGILFIDEAYSLVDPSRPDGNTFGKEAISVLIKAMEDYRDNLCVILAGYKDEMEGFLSVNPGMKSRIPFVLEFEDYTPNELLGIFAMECAKRQYVVEPGAEEYLFDLFDRNLGRMKELGNGRFARNVLEAAITHQSRRLGSRAGGSSAQELVTLTAEDLMAWEQERSGRR